MALTINHSRKTGHATVSIPSVLRGVAASAIVAGAVVAATGDVAAHENHAPLPTKGVTIAGDTIMLSDKARDAIGLTTAKSRVATSIGPLPSMHGSIALVLPGHDYLAGARQDRTGIGPSR